MNTFSSPLNRLVAAAVLVAVLVIAVTAIVLLPGSALAQAAGPEQATPQPADPPVATPEPGAVEAVIFQPQVWLTRGQSLVSTQGVDKPAGDAGVAMEKPPAEQHVGPQEAYTPPDYAQLLDTLDWSLELYEGFEGVFPGAWILEDFSNDGYQRTWGDTDYISQSGWWSAWPAAYGADALDPHFYYYPNNLDSWMEYGPFDFSDVADVLVRFGLWYETEPEDDRVYFCASIDFVNYDCAHWSGLSGGWTDQAYLLTSYAGYSQVWLAWIFESDSDYEIDDGPFVDEIYVYVGSEPVEGQLIQNGSFETGDLTDWSTDSWSSMSALEAQIGQFPSLRPDTDQELALDNVNPLEGGVGILDVGVITDTFVDGQYSAFLSRSGGFGVDFLYQTIVVPSSVTDFVLNFWSRVGTQETNLDTDLFCVGLWSPDFSELLVDLGCLDAIETTGLWQEIVHTLTYGEVVQVAGQSVALAFELYNDGDAGSGTTVWVDAVQVQAVGGEGGGYLDLNEPNDTWDSATAITCGTAISGTIGDALGGYDVDWFKMSNVPSGQIDIDITADVADPPSALDSVVDLWDSSLNWLDGNDDDDVSYDSYVVYTNTVESATFYISVESYSGYGSADSFYTMTVQCAGSGSGPPAGEEPVEPVADTWTVMLYLNAEDPGFEYILTQYRTDIEAFIGDKSDFLNVLVLYDGSDNGDTVRYLVQPNGVYVSRENLWNMGELNMGDPDTLADFASWAMDQYPAENYYLAVDDHGDGVYGISFDSTSNNDQLTPPELYSALKSATLNGARKIHIFDYEACLMGLAENAYDLRQWVDYVVFSEQISWGINTYPLYFSDLAATDTPLDVGQRIVESYHAEAMVAGGRGYPHTISLIDTSQMENVSAAVTNFGDAIRATDTQAQKDAINDARDRSQAFAADIDATNPVRAEYIDLWDLADEASSLVPAQAAAIKSAVQAAVVRERYASGGVSDYTWDHSGAHGLAIYYPPTKSSSAFDSYVGPSLYQMSQDGTWDEFLDWALSSGTRRGMYASRSQSKLASAGDAFVFKYVYLPVVVK